MPETRDGKVTPLSIRCPYCWSNPGEPCTRPLNRPMAKPHLARVQAFFDQKTAKPRTLRRSLQETTHG